MVVPNPRPIDNVMNQIQREKCTYFPGVPAMYIGVINHPEVSRYDLTTVRACISGAAPLPMEVQEKFGEITGGRLVEGYGLTEAAPVTHCNPVYGLRKSGSIGVPLPDVEAKLVTLEPDKDGHFAEVPTGEPGELALRGPQVMQGYWGKAEDTAGVKDADGWLYTGDIARMDEDGYFYIVDRKKDLIIASGYNIVPREVEEVLFMHPKVHFNVRPNANMKPTHATINTGRQRWDRQPAQIPTNAITTVRSPRFVRLLSLSGEP